MKKSDIKVNIYDNLYKNIKKRKSLAKKVKLFDEKTRKGKVGLKRQTIKVYLKIKRNKRRNLRGKKGFISIFKFAVYYIER